MGRLLDSIRRAEHVEEKRALRQHAQQRGANAIRRKVEAEQALPQSIEIREQLARQTGQIQEEIVSATRQLRLTREQRLDVRVGHWLRPTLMAMRLPVLDAVAAGYVMSTRRSSSSGLLNLTTDAPLSTPPPSAQR